MTNTRQLKIRVIATVCAALVMSALWCTQAFAASDDYQVKVQPAGDVAVVAPASQTDAATVSSMQLNFSVKPEVADAGVAFAFDDGLPAKVREYRYNADAHELHVYIAGRTPLFSDGSSLDVGSIEVQADGKPVAALVSLADGGLRFANGTGSSTPSVAVAAATQVNPEASQGTGSEQLRQQLDDLLAGLEAKPYAKGDYTAESYEAYLKAKANAAAVLANADATDQELQDAYDALKQAIDGLKPAAAGSADSQPAGTPDAGSGDSDGAIRATMPATGDVAAPLVAVVVVVALAGVVLCVVARRRGSARK